MNDTLWPQIPDFDKEKAPHPPPRSRYVSVSVDPGWATEMEPALQRGDLEEDRPPKMITYTIYRYKKIVKQR